MLQHHTCHTVIPRPIALGWVIRHPTNVRHQANVSLFLLHRVRRWPNIKQTLGQCLLFARQLDRLNNAPAANLWEAPSWWEARGPSPPPWIRPCTSPNNSFVMICCVVRGCYVRHPLSYISLYNDKDLTCSIPLFRISMIDNMYLTSLHVLSRCIYCMTIINYVCSIW